MDPKAPKKSHQGKKSKARMQEKFARKFPYRFSWLMETSSELLQPWELTKMSSLLREQLPLQKTLLPTRSIPVRGVSVGLCVASPGWGPRISCLRPASSCHHRHQETSGSWRCWPTASPGLQPPRPPPGVPLCTACLWATRPPGAWGRGDLWGGEEPWARPPSDTRRRFTALDGRLHASPTFSSIKRGDGQPCTVSVTSSRSPPSTLRRLGYLGDNALE